MKPLNEISGAIVNEAIHIHSELGAGLLESVYEVILADRLVKLGFQIERQKPIPIHFEGTLFPEGFRADIIVEKSIILEIKSVETLSKLHHAQLKTYLKFSGYHLGLLINFGAESMRENIKRIVVGEVPNLKNFPGPRVPPSLRENPC